MLKVTKYSRLWYNIDMNKEICYYTEFKDANGHEHYAIHMYNRLTGFVTTMRDLKFS